MRSRDARLWLSIGRAAPVSARRWRRFNRDWSRRVLGQGAITLLITDGLERDSVDRLEVEMERLAKSSRRVIWVNPLLRFDAFAAKAGGIRAMLPHVDLFRPIHNLASMADLCQALSGAGDLARGAEGAAPGGRLTCRGQPCEAARAGPFLGEPTGRGAERKRNDRRSRRNCDGQVCDYPF